MGYIDFHCHLDGEDFSENRKKLIENIFNSGISHIITVADPYDEKSHDITEEILNYNRNIFSMSAAHPHNADSYNLKIEKKILDFLEIEKVVGVGEAGLDYHYNLSKPENQIRVFKRQISIAKEAGLPLIIHSREAEKDVIGILEEFNFDNPVVFHCYTGNSEDAAEIIKRGYYISFSGIITFKKADYLRRIVSEVPFEKLFSETDSPYLAPVPFRGKTNSPEKVRYVADKIAEIKAIPVDDLNRKIEENFNRVINLKTQQFGE